MCNGGFRGNIKSYFAKFVDLAVWSETPEFGCRESSVWLTSFDLLACKFFNIGHI
jgi:hypothetical protein